MKQTAARMPRSGSSPSHWTGSRCPLTRRRRSGCSPAESGRPRRLGATGHGGLTTFRLGEIVYFVSKHDLDAGPEPKKAQRGINVRFAVLGSLEVADDQGEPVVLSSARQRVLLAILLCHANQVVS